MKRKTVSIQKISRLFKAATIVFCCILIVISSIAVYFAAHDRFNRIRSTMEMIVTYTAQEYESITENFWQAYMPIVEASDEDSALLTSYFLGTSLPQPLDRVKLSDILQRMCLRDDRISWILLYSPSQPQCVIQYSGDHVLSIASDNFPYLENLQSKDSQMEIYGRRVINESSCFAIAGGLPNMYGEGSILIGYQTSAFEHVDHLLPSSAPSMFFRITCGSEVIFSSDQNYDTYDLNLSDGNGEGILIQNGKKEYALQTAADYSSNVICAMDYSELLKETHRFTPLLILLVAAFFAFSLFLTKNIQALMEKEVGIIRDGFAILSTQDNGYQIPTDFTREDLSEIAQDINEMNSRLNESIRKAYYFELKQKDAQMAEMQAAFNPHFLYNTMEMLRNQCYENGDKETSELIANMASIFRSFIGAKTFVPFGEELALSRRYVSLMVKRYGDQVRARYDIESKLLSYGIIRNVFQILIENYFVHGFDPERSDNEIDFIGKETGETDILIQVADNGYGLEPEQIERLNQSIAEPLRHSKKNFGLRNLNQRIKLFYGPDYGLTIKANPGGGVVVSILIRKITVEEYEKKFQRLDEEVRRFDSGAEEAENK